MANIKASMYSRQWVHRLRHEFSLGIKQNTKYKNNSFFLSQQNICMPCVNSLITGVFS